MEGHHCLLQAEIEATIPRLYALPLYFFPYQGFLPAVAILSFQRFHCRFQFASFSLSPLHVSFLAFQTVLAR